jgi:hypothetical protein
MAKTTDKSVATDSEPPTQGLAFMVGLVLFSIILCPAGVLAAWMFKLYTKFGLNILQSFSIGCIMGFVVAIIPALIFMRATMKRMRKR